MFVQTGGFDKQIAARGELIRAREIFADKKVARIRSDDVMREDMSCLVDVVAAEGSFVAVVDVFIRKSGRRFWVHLRTGAAFVRGTRICMA